MPEKDFELVITTYNRRESVVSLVKSVLACEPAPSRVIVVDSSDHPIPELAAMPAVHYLRSNLAHQNQPYKRLVGALAARTEQIVFLDDDLEILDRRVFGKLLAPFFFGDVVGASIAVQYDNWAHHADKRVRGVVGRLLLYVSGVSTPKEGRLGWAGNVGPRPRRSGQVESLNGTVMAFSRSIFLRLVDASLLAPFECQLAIPEDKILSMRAQAFGKLWWVPDVALRHPPVKSTYFAGERNFTKRVHLSRLLLNREYCRFRGYPAALGLLHYWYFSFWRVLIAACRLVASPTPGARERLRGIVDAIRLSIGNRLSPRVLCPGVMFLQDAERDATAAATGVSREYAVTS
jgi:glycosyltransferase involved in cell wall biosynthesis